MKRLEKVDEETQTEDKVNYSKETQTTNVFQVKFKDSPTQVTKPIEKSFVDVSTSPLFTKVEIGDMEQYTSCLCKCHGHYEMLPDGKILIHNIERSEIENCNLQLFMYTNDENKAVQAVQYYDDYDDDN